MKFYPDSKSQYIGPVIATSVTAVVFFFLIFSDIGIVPEKKVAQTSQLDNPSYSQSYVEFFIQNREPVRFNTVVVDTPELRQKGLGGRTSLASDEAMLFIFESDDRYAFWMKDMLFPIDIIWISADNLIVDFVENISPDTYPESFAPKTNARMVLEVQAGVVQKNNFKIGDRVNIVK